MSLIEIYEELDNMRDLDINELTWEMLVMSLRKILKIIGDDKHLNKIVNSDAIVMDKLMDIMLKLIKMTDCAINVVPNKVIYRYGKFVKKFPHKKSEITHSRLPFVFQLESYCTIYNIVLFIKN